jgi:hypothetical protein
LNESPINSKKFLMGISWRLEVKNRYGFEEEN